MRLTELEKANPQDYFLQSGIDNFSNAVMETTKWQRYS